MKIKKCITVFFVFLIFLMSSFQAFAAPINSSVVFSYSSNSILIKHGKPNSKSETNQNSTNDEPMSSSANKDSSSKMSSDSKSSSKVSDESKLKNTSLEEGQNDINKSNIKLWAIVITICVLIMIASIILMLLIRKL